jgi:hypothetical protein
LIRERERSGALDLEASEMAIRGSMHEVGGVILGKIVNADGGGHKGPRIECGNGHEADFIDYRVKELTTVLSVITSKRAYYYCRACGEGIIPKDQEMNVVRTSFSPGVRRMIGRVGSKEPFDEGRSDLETLAGIAVKTKQVERLSEAIGRQIEAVAIKEREAVMSGKLLSMEATPAKLYVAIDGTGVPVVPREAEGRPGKGGGRAKSREAKLGCIFTQTIVDAEGWPVRDPASTTYVGAIEAAPEFGRRIYAEAIRRGIGRAGMVIVLGDGAPWIWNIADLHFPGAIQIVDLYHAREHVSSLSKVIYGTAPKAAKWARAVIDLLDEGKVEAVLARIARLRPNHKIGTDEVRKALHYFQTNKERMRYAHFRSLGLFVGSGVVEAGCKTIIGRRFKQSGMRWTVGGANAIIALRCCELSGRWEDFWADAASA